MSSTKYECPCCSFEYSTDGLCPICKLLLIPYVTEFMYRCPCDSCENTLATSHVMPLSLCEECGGEWQPKQAYRRKRYLQRSRWQQFLTWLGLRPEPYTTDWRIR